MRRINPEHVTLREWHQSATTEESRRYAAGSFAAPSLRSGALLRMTDDWRLEVEALVFSTNFRMGFDITDFQAVLPKNYIHHVVPGEPIYDFFEAWKQSAAETSALKAYGLRQWFIQSAASLAQKGYKINLHKKFLSRGYLIWEL